MTGRRWPFVENARARRGLTHETLAAQLGVSRSHLGHVLIGARGLTLDLADNLAQVLGVSLDDLARTRPPVQRGAERRST